MTSHDQSEGGLPAESQHERRKRMTLAKKMSKRKRDRQALLDACYASREKLERLAQKTRDVRYLWLDSVYAALCVAELDRELMKAVEKEAARLEVPRNKATCTALLFVRTFAGGHIEPATAWQQAEALRGASLKGIKPGELAEHLKEEGIVKLAEYFRKETKPKAPVPDKDGDEGTTTADSKPGATDTSADDDSDGEDTVLSGPALAWPEELVPIWDRATRERQRLKLVVKPDDGETGTVIKASLLPQAKREGKCHES
ncbi:MAG: hypothetical protein ACM33T_00415 [Solirubrobacterales bacterium]